MRKVTRRFLDYGWAWPSGEHHLLMSSVLHWNDDVALAAGLSWLATHDLDAISFREQRLLAALAARFGKRLSASPAFPRLAGLQKLMWSRSQMALRDAREGLQVLHADDLPFMLLKGASRVAVERQAQLGRVSHDVDILVRPEQMRAALQRLSDLGWVAASGASPGRLAAQAPQLRATNLLNGEFGDIDLHAAAYHPVHRSDADDIALWQRALPSKLSGVPVLVPSAADRIALAIAHGSFDAHVHSDWLVDIDACMRNGAVDWPVLVGICEQRGLVVPAASALTYLAEMGAPIPGDILDTLISAADRSGLPARLALVEAKPRGDGGMIAKVGRGVLKQLRLARARRDRSTSDDVIWRRYFAARGHVEPGQERTRFDRDVAPDVSETSLRISLSVRVPGRPRRVDWEISTAGRHIATLRYRKLLPWQGVKKVTFVGDCALDPDAQTLTIAARPSRYLRPGHSAADLERFGALPFQLISIISKRH